MARILVTGAAGFIGSHAADRLLHDGHHVTGVDNFVRGRRENLRTALAYESFCLLEKDLSTNEGCHSAFQSAIRFGAIDAVWHLAANSDIPAGVSDASVDLRDTFLTTFHVLDAMRRFDVPVLVFASSSAIYGIHDRLLAEDDGPLLPISNYGAMKLASEGAISAAVETFLSRAYLLRFPNVLGDRATHGVIFDLIARLRSYPRELTVLGDGNQQKPYLHVSELIDAILFILENSQEPRNYFNVAPADDGVTVRSIAETVVRLVAPGTPIRYGSKDRGWPGDVPKFRYATDKLRALGWQAKMSSIQAVERATLECSAPIGACNS